MWQVIEADYVIIGSGIAGLTLSLLLSRHGQVALVTKGAVRHSNSSLAQGGIAAALSADDDASLHRVDTLRTGQGLCETETVQSFVSQAADAVRFLQQLGVKLDCAADGTPQLGKEGAHSRNRIVHAGGDATGRTIIQTLTQHLCSNPRIDLWENTYVAELLLENGECTGAIGKDSDGNPVCFRAKAVILATGGLGQLYKYTTNAAGTTGEGYALAYRAGALLRDMEFVQFHPTALRTHSNPLPLVSEAVRGEGAVLVNANGERFMHFYHDWADLASRDIVARAIFSEMQAGRDVFLDARSIPQFARRFPTIHASCQKIGLDPSADLIPVVPAAHYTMGGILSDSRGVTSVPRLFAIGEAASSGFHGANRLASNSLLEGLVMAHRAVEAIVSLRPVRWRFRTPDFSYADFVKMNTSPSPTLLRQVQELMWTHVGIVRDGLRLNRALQQLRSWQAQLPPGPGPEQNLLTAARLVVQAALWRRESRGAHFRADYPETAAAFQTHSIQGGTYESVARTPVASASVD
ncbi:L-aspartate oxidase [Effusibacillus pohliae]|uniref:L-aspartate oxidase n=1 Tax=Effusibacillus pohliae TaxID=232270 RepID=UPI0003665636|nr:L-aspartate oxidase [Effusibacillus pohliae]